MRGLVLCAGTAAVGVGLLFCLHVEVSLCSAALARTRIRGQWRCRPGNNGSAAAQTRCKALSSSSVTPPPAPPFHLHGLNNMRRHSTRATTYTPPLPIEDYIRQLGYPVESHEIQTEDGYLLTYHRIPYGKGKPSSTTPGPPVILQHGLLCASTVWVMGPDAFGYLLADSGFDVWLGNARGNTYSRKHIKYDPDTDKESFFDYSWHEMGYYDLPASIDYILNQTGRSQLVYIGHSMGTTMYFVLGATRPEYMDKIQMSVLLAPVAFTYNIRSPLFKLTFRLEPLFQRLLRNRPEVWRYSNRTVWLTQHLCGRHQLQFICRDIIFATSGFDNAQLSKVLLPMVLQYLPAGTSRKTLRHYTQINNKDAGFRQFDYGYKENLWKYGRPQPPSYNLSRAMAPISIYYGENDWVAGPEDVMYTASLLPNVLKVTKVPYEKFNHVDFMWATDAKTLLFDDIIETLHNATSNSNVFEKE